MLLWDFIVSHLMVPSRINNDFDSFRFNTSITVDEETQYFYIQPFIAAVKAGVLSVMCSYNRVK